MENMNPRDILQTVTGPVKPVIIIIQGKQYPLRFTINSLCALEAQLNKPVSHVLAQRYQKQMSIVLCRSLFWAALLHNNDKLSLLEAGDILNAALEDRSFTLAEFFAIMDRALLTALTLYEEPKTDQEPATSEAADVQGDAAKRNP